MFCICCLQKLLMFIISAVLCIDTRGIFLNSEILKVKLPEDYSEN